MSENTPAGAVQRRTVVAGAAWTIPVVATAVGAPLAAASPTTPPEPPCPDISTRAGWFYRNEGIAFLPIVPGDANDWTSPTQFTWTLGSAWNGPGLAPTADGVLRRTLDVQAGTTYTFDYNLWSAGNTDWSASPGFPAGLKFYVDGGEKVFDLTRQTVPIVDGVISGPFARTASYTATTTKTITVEFRFIAYPRNGKPNQDNFSVTMPRITCTR